MKISAIISEYNPLHNGHLYHISKTKELTNSDALICVMSGSFVQRGLPAILDKWTRASMALQNGIDLVIELPVLYSVSSAEFFSFGAVSLLDNLGVVDYLSFGSEAGNINFLKEVSKVLVNETPEFKEILKANLDEGLVFPAARSKALIQMLAFNEYFQKYSTEDLSSLLNSANNILGIEYCKSLLNLKSTITPLTIKRQGGAYNSESLQSENISNQFSSATSIRKFLKSTYTSSIEELKPHIPPVVYETLLNLRNSNYYFVNPEDIVPYIRYKYFTSKSNMAFIPDVSEGIENKIYKGLEKGFSYSELLDHIKSKRYALSRISRILCQYFIGFENYPTSLLRKSPCSYARILGFNSTGAKVLRKIKECSSIPLYTKIPKSQSLELQLDIQSTKAYSLLNPNISPMEDYFRSPVIIK